MVTGPLDGLAQVIVNGSPAFASIPAGGLLMTLLLLPCAVTNAAKARTSGIQESILFGIVILGLVGEGRVCSETDIS